jgi:F0F1-type ATP synthase membrane subunit b/b'
LNKMANKKRGAAFLIIFFVIVAFLAYQVNSYMQEQNEIKASYDVANEKLLSAQQHFQDAKTSADKATQAFNSLN